MSFAWTCFHHLMNLAEAQKGATNNNPGTQETENEDRALMALLISFLKVRIGAMLAYTPLDEKSLALLLSYLQDFLKWVFARSPPVLLLAYRERERVKCCFVAGILWRTLHHFSMPVTTRWLLQSTTARPFKSLLYFTTWSFWVFKSVWSQLSQLWWGCDSRTSLHGLMEGWLMDEEGRIQESHHTQASTNWFSFMWKAAEQALPASVFSSTAL